MAKTAFFKAIRKLFPSFNLLPIKLHQVLPLPTTRFNPNAVGGLIGFYINAISTRLLKRTPESKFKKFQFMVEGVDQPCMRYAWI